VKSILLCVFERDVQFINCVRFLAYVICIRFWAQLSRATVAFICRQSSVPHYAALRYATLNVYVPTSASPHSAFSARQKACWTYSKGNPAKYRNDVCEKIQSEEQVHARRIWWRNKITTTILHLHLQIHHWNLVKHGIYIPVFLYCTCHVFMFF